jgi:hypothetical protein
MVHERIMDSLDSALTSVFSENGKRTVLYYLTEKYSVTLERASRDPKKLEESLTNLLGEGGWTVVKRRILQEIYGPSFEVGSVSTETPSLGDAFDLVRFLRTVMGQFRSFLKATQDPGDAMLSLL